jgi:hypothetical protein
VLRASDLCGGIYREFKKQCEDKKYRGCNRDSSSRLLEKYEKDNKDGCDEKYRIVPYTVGKKSKQSKRGGIAPFQKPPSVAAVYPYAMREQNG